MKEFSKRKSSVRPTPTSSRRTAIELEWPEGPSVVDMIRDELVKSLKTPLFTGLSGVEADLDRKADDLGMKRMPTAYTSKSEPCLTPAMIDAAMMELYTDRKLADCAGCKRPVLKSQYNGYLVYMDRYYHLDCLARTLQGMELGI